jgi:hypothetical protein
MRRSLKASRFSAYLSVLGIAGRAYGAAGLALIVLGFLSFVFKAHVQDPLKIVARGVLNDPDLTASIALDWRDRPQLAVMLVFVFCWFCALATLALSRRPGGGSVRKTFKDGTGRG